MMLRTARRTGRPAAPRPSAGDARPTATSPSTPATSSARAPRAGWAKRIGVGAAALGVQMVPPLLIFGGWSKFAGHPARRALAAVAVAGAVTAGANGLTLSRGRRHVSRQRLAPALALGGVLAGRLLSPLADRRGWLPLGHDGVRYAGVAACAAGLALFEWPRVLMREQFSFNAAIQPGHRLVTAGPYSVIRHPGYAGLILMNLGYALAYGNKLGLIPVGVVAGTLVWRMHDEERLLESEFGAEYRDYQGRTARLVPGLY